MMLPTIHLNGTSARDLYEENRAAAHALREAIAKLQAAAPNGRDYYPQGPLAISQALEEHQTRLEALEAVLSALNVIASRISNHLSNPEEAVCKHCKKVIATVPPHYCPRSPNHMHEVAH